MPDNPTGRLTISTGIGALRWLVVLFHRTQEPAADLALEENFIPLGCARAAIEPTWEKTFWESTQVESPVTDAITIRWRNFPQTVDVVICPTIRPDSGLVRGALYRVRRSKEIGGRKRFIVMMCELERSRTLPNAMHATLVSALTEPYDGQEAAPPP